MDTDDRLRAAAGFEVVQVAQTDFHRAVDRFESSDRLAFGDATTAAYMEREGVEYLYRFEADFDAIDRIARLDGAIDPFDPG